MDALEEIPSPLALAAVGTIVSPLRSKTTLLAVIVMPLPVLTVRLPVR